jgi:L-rhamnose isomerase
MQKALLRALLTPWDLLKEAQDNSDHTKVLALQEEIKVLPWNEVWNKYCKIHNCEDEKTWYKHIEKYENEVLLKRG